MEALELFAGAGGLALGMSQAGFGHAGVFELDKNACDTIRLNQSAGTDPVTNWPLFPGDVSAADFSQFAGVDLVTGGPPCQPFSIGGKHRGQNDRRNLFPQLVRAVRETQPKAVIVENVPGLLRPSFARYFEYILLQIGYPELQQKNDERWESHLSRLEKHHTRGTQSGLTYKTIFQKLNAADYGVPQRRQRVFIVAVREDLHRECSFPEPTHSHDALIYDQYVSGEYWDRHRVSKSQRLKPSDRLIKRINRLRDMSLASHGQPWLTVRDAICDLPDPVKSSQDHPFFNHRFNPGAKTYPGHTGSPVDEPAKTLKAGDHGVPGGENMIAHPNGKVRYFTVRESARLQTFPDNVQFSGSWTETMRQLGNAVPVKLAATVGKAVRNNLSM